MSDYQKDDHILLQFGFFDSPASEFEGYSFKMKDVLRLVLGRLSESNSDRNSWVINVCGTLVPVFDRRERLDWKNILRDNLMIGLLKNESDLLTCFIDSKVPGIVNSVFRGVLWNLVNTARLEAGHIKCIVKMNGLVYVFLNLNKLLSSDGCLVYPAGMA